MFELSSNQRRFVTIATVVVALGILLWGWNRVSKREEARRDAFAKWFLESVRDDVRGYEPFVRDDYRQDVREAARYLQRPYEIKPGATSAGQHDYRIRFADGACGMLHVWDGPEYRAAVFAWPEGAAPCAEAEPK